MRQTKYPGIITVEEPLPADLTHRHALFVLYAVQDWECLPVRPDPYAPGFFYNRIQPILHGLNNVSRQNAFRHMASQACLVCDVPIDLTKTTLDHLMPRADGGPETPSNVLMLCRRCNSSKGARDLLEWWQWKQYKVGDLPRAILCLYARIYWQHLGHDRLQQSAPVSTRTFLAERWQILPSDGHRIAIIGAAYAGCAFTRWLQG